MLLQPDFAGPRRRVEGSERLRHEHNEKSPATNVAGLFGSIQAGSERAVLAPMHLQVIFNLFHAVDLAQSFLGHLLLIIRGDGASQNDPSLASFEPQLLPSQVRAALQRRASTINKLGVDHKPDLPIERGGRNVRYREAAARRRIVAAQNCP